MISIETRPIAYGNGYARITRYLAVDRAELARKTAHPGEPHAKARARIVAFEEAAARRLERVLFFGETDAR